VATAAVVGAWLVLARLVLGTACTLLEVLPGAWAGRSLVGGLGAALTPGPVRAAVQRSVRVGLVAGAVGAAVVVPTTFSAAASAPVAAAALDDDPARTDWPLLDRPATPEPGHTAAAGHEVAEDYRVRPGDSLWTIAEAHLPPGSGAPSIAEAWPRWWQANRHVIGDDPGLILPGQRLRAPGSTT
jgi:nucleoid-associated protein YgaU